VKIREMNTSARARSCLLSAGYMYVSEIISMTDEEFLKIHNLNRKCLEEIRKVLDSYTWDDEEREYLNSQIRYLSSIDNSVYESPLEQNDNQNCAKGFELMDKDEGANRSHLPVINNYTEIKAQADNQDDSHIGYTNPGKSHKLLSVVQSTTVSKKDLSGDSSSSMKIDNNNAVYPDDDNNSFYLLDYKLLSVDELWRKIRDREKGVDEKYGDDCQLLISDRYGNVGKVFKIGSLIHCLEATRDNMNALREDEQFVIQYGVNSWNTIGPFRDFSEVLQQAWRYLIWNIPVPFDNSVLPDSYKSFSQSTINDSNYKQLWDELQKIEDKYRKGINYANRFILTEWESELCYEQGKFLEYVKWDGGEIDIVPEKVIYNCSYSKMDYDQLRYYIYWRTQFKNGNVIITGNKTFFFLYTYEMLAEFGPYSPEERLQQLEKLFKSIGIYQQRIAVWIGQYADLHHLEIQDDVVKSYAYWKRNSPLSLENINAIINGNYENAFEYMCKKSAWKYSSSTFIKKANCITNIKKVVEIILPKLETLFSNAGISFSDFLVGRVKGEKQLFIPYDGSIWIQSVLQRVGIKIEPRIKYTWEYADTSIYITDIDGNIKRKTNTSMKYVDPYLSEYILRYTEMLFRKRFGYEYISFPLKLKGALKLKFADGYNYVLSANPDLQKREIIYLSLYDEIDRIINITVEDYFLIHDKELECLKENFKNEHQNPILPKVIPFERKPSTDELMIDCIKDYKKGQFEKLLEIYNNSTPSFKKTKVRRTSRMIWDYWIIRENQTSYESLSEIVVKNSWFIKEKKAIIERNYAIAFPYLCSFYNVLNGVVSKRIEPKLIRDCTIICFTLIDYLFSSYGIDSSNILLGELVTLPWEPFHDIEELQNVRYDNTRKNIGDIEVYSINSENRSGSVSRHSYSEQAGSFIMYVMKSIENNFRILIGYKALLKVEIKINELFHNEGYFDACSFIDSVISGVSNYVYQHNNPLILDTQDIPKVVVSKNTKIEYLFIKSPALKTDIRTFIGEKLKDFYGDSYSGLTDVPGSDMSRLDFDSFDLKKQFIKYVNKIDVYQHFSKIQVNRFYDIYKDILTRFSKLIECYPVTYNPEYDFRTSSLMSQVNGLTGKDLTTLTNLVSDNEAFLQWVIWIEHGQFIIPKNMPYIQILFHFAMNRLIFAKEPEKCLFLLCEVWNYYYELPEKMDTSSDLILEWIKDYWMVYCHTISYTDFKKLLRHNVIFENESDTSIAKDHFCIDISTLDQDNLLDFYNRNCDYHVLEGLTVRTGYSDVLENALEEVHKELKSLWNEYDINFEDYIHFEDRVQQEKEREIFYRGILTDATKEYLRNTFEGRKVSENEEYRTGYNNKRDWPVLVYDHYEISNSSSRILLEYIIKNTEIVIRDHLGLKHTFKINHGQLYDHFPIQLFKDNARRHIIMKTIMRTTEEVCREHGI